MMLKKCVKKILPDRVIRIYRESKELPEYIRTVIKNNAADYPKLSFYTDEETVNLIVTEGKSLSRFGDGEIRWMNHIELDSFQSYSEELAECLLRAYKTENPNLLIGIPYGLIDARRCSWGSRMHWRIIRNEFFTNIIKVGGLNRTFANASITRPYIDYNDREYSRKCFDNLKQIWNSRDIIFVEGAKTKLGMGNDLFDNAKSIRRIICPATNAFEKINEIKAAIRKHAKKGDLILVALGPTASILAADMCNEGYQIIDVGHVDVEYVWYQRGDLLRTPIEGKYVNESGEKNQSNLYENDLHYTQSVICRIG